MKGYFSSYLFLMHKIKIFWIIFCVFVFAMFCVITIKSNAQVFTFTFEQQILGYSDDSQEETKLPIYRTHGVEKVTFYLKNYTPLYPIHNTRHKKELDERFFDSEGEAVYYAYPLSRLQVDLFIDKGERFFTDGSGSVVLDGDSADTTLRFTSYQKPSRNRSEILAFLSALAGFQTQQARQALIHHPDLLPFDRIQFTFQEIWAGDDKVYGKLLFE